MATFDIQLKNVTIKFDNQILLKEVCLHVHSGEIFVLIGPSGLGKSVLLKIMAGLILPSEGEVLIGGENLLTLSGAEQNRLRQKMGMLFQKNALFDSLTVAENLAFPLRESSGETTKITEEEITKRINFFLTEVGIDHARNLFPDEISGGMQKRLGIARALALNPKIIFYDDPTAGLDPITSRKIVQLILNLQKEAKSTVVAITNDMNRAYQMADRIGMIVDQQLIITGNIDETRKSQDPRVKQFIQGALQGPLSVQG